MAAGSLAKGRHMDTAALFSLAGRTALVTGGSRGIGRMIAEGFVQQGATVYISARSAEACEETAAELSAGGGSCIALPQDISTVAGCHALAEAYGRHARSLDILVNNAGSAWGAPLSSFPESGWDKVMDLNVKSPFFLTQALLEPLEAAAVEHPSKVINIASIDGLGNNAWETYSYHASKAALLQVTRRMAVTLVHRRVHVNAIAPGAFASRMNRAARDSAEEVSRRIPARRIGTPEDMAGAAIFLASRAGDYVIGDTLVVDGGVLNAAVNIGAAGGPMD
jgi:NAD(P)-dependent dehydrogenase (short-subunit alcohol dehydrogenase family)